MTNLEKMQTNKDFLVLVLSNIESDDPIFINSVSSEVCKKCKYGENGDKSCCFGDGNDCKNPLTFEESIDIWLNAEVV
jgi:hypothetical protein